MNSEPNHPESKLPSRRLQLKGSKVTRTINVEDVASVYQRFAIRLPIHKQLQDSDWSCNWEWQLGLVPNISIGWFKVCIFLAQIMLDWIGWLEFSSTIETDQMGIFVGQVAVELARAQANKTPGNTINKNVKKQRKALLIWRRKSMTTLGRPTDSASPPISVKAKAAQRLSAQQRKRK